MTSRPGPRPRPAKGTGRPSTQSDRSPTPQTTSSVLDRATALATDWGPTAGRILLGLVLAWFGYHELIQPALWTGYVPVVNAQSDFAIVLVLAHGWVLLILAVALVAGIMPRVAAAGAALLLLEIVISLSISGGLSDLTLRDVGVLGLAVALTGLTNQRLMLTR